MVSKQIAFSACISLSLGASPKEQTVLDSKPKCANYERWSQVPHGPVTKGLLSLPFQRPPEHCRTFESDAVENKLLQIQKQIKDVDIARLWENTFPNTLDTTIKYHQGGSQPLTFIVTGDIDAEWLRDSQHQLGPYLNVLQDLPDNEALLDPLSDLFKGAIAQQARYVSRAPHCNAFQAPPESNIPSRISNEGDYVWPYVSPFYAFECKYELDSLASFLGLSNSYYEATHDRSFMTKHWRTAIVKMLNFVNHTTVGTYDLDSGVPNAEPYRFRRWTNLGSETHWNQGAGNPVKYTGMARSWFRPSDDACVYQYFVPANAQMSVELAKLAKYVNIDEKDEIGKFAAELSKQIKDAIWEHAVFDHPEFGKVFAYEVDGYGSALFMDDANLPSLLSLPDMGFVSSSDKTYQRTRKMVTSTRGNPYYIKGEYFEGIGGPHVGIRAAWPMSRIVAMRTTDDIKEIREHMYAVVKSTKGLGLIHESVNVDNNDYSRPWFAWANSEFAKTILDLNRRGLLERATENLFSN